MNVLVFMIPIAILLGGAFLGAFIWAVQAGQFDDTSTPPHRILGDDENREDHA